MTKFTKQGNKIIAIDTEANNKLIRIQQAKKYLSEPLTIREDEDIAFGSLSMYIEHKTSARTHRFWQL